MMNRILLMTWVWLTGCNLTLDTDEYPYTLLVDLDAGRHDVTLDGVVEPDVPEDMLPDIERDVPVDMPMGEVALMITELMINTSEMAGGSNGEAGEYIEVKNVGDAAADPRRVSFQIVTESGEPQSIAVTPPTSPDQIEIYTNLLDIQPGDYFVFVRYSTTGFPASTLLDPGTFFDYGKAGASPGLGNSGERTLTVQYFDGTTIRPHDSVRWNGNALRPSDVTMAEPSLGVIEDVALSVGRDFESPQLNDDPAHWCQEITEIAGAGTFFGSPGKGATCTL